MIEQKNLIPVGKAGKSHGIGGEIKFEFSADFDFDACAYVIFEIDGIFVPFFVNDFRFTNDITAIVKLEGVDDENATRMFTGKTIYLEKKQNVAIGSDEGDFSHWLGFMVEDANGKELGKILDFDDSTENILLKIGDFIIPLRAIKLLETDEEHRFLKMDLPEGLLNL